MAARLDEIAEGVASVLGLSATPEPLRVDMMNHSPVDVAFFVRALAAACERREAPLALVRLSPELGERLVRAVEREPLALADVQIELAEDLGVGVEMYRRSPAQSP
jgi:hypothetical protein